jgi:hypothetical protein
VSTPVPGEGPHRRAAKGCLNDTAKCLDEIPIGRVNTDVMTAHAAKSQVFATAAVAHALLELGDVLRATLRGAADE